MTKKERVLAVLDNKKADVIPAGFWFHYDESLDPRLMAEEHLKTFRETGGDILKLMQDYIQKIDVTVSVPSHWQHVKYPGVSSPVYGKLLEVLKRILDQTGGEALVFQTMFGPFKTAVQSFGDALVMNHVREAPEAVIPAIRGIAEVQTEWAAGFIEAGADGLFYAAQFSEPGRFSRTEWDDLVRSGDLKLLMAAESRGGRNILHICGEPEYQFRTNPQWYTDYPFGMVNWSVKDTAVSLAQGRELFGARPVLGGMNNKGNILNGNDESIAAEAKNLIRGFGSPEGLMIGADCTIQGKGISRAKMRAAVEAVHNFRF
jgi:uroporphyrinogen decarboxylase